jgi:hypothetical protein
MEFNSRNFNRGCADLEKSTPPAWGGFGQNEQRGTAEASRSRSVAMPQRCWWEAGWFKDWERVARGS